MSSQRRNSEEQYRLIMECRTSGLTDYQWCKQNDINPGTFYNWVSRLRKKSSLEIPKSISKNTSNAQPKPEIVPLEIVSEQPVQDSFCTADSLFPHQTTGPDSFVPTIHIVSGTTQIDLTNAVDPSLLSQILFVLGGTRC